MRMAPKGPDLISCKGTSKIHVPITEIKTSTQTNWHDRS